MAYSLYLDGVLLPVTPAKFTIKIKNQNKTINLINEGEVNVLKKAGLTDIQFELLLPQVRYPFAEYPEGFQSAEYYIGVLERLKVKRKKFRCIFSRTMPNGGLLFDTNMRVSLEDYQLEEDAKNGFDIVATVKLRQYRSYGTKTVELAQETATVTEQRPTDSPPTPPQQAHTVVKGDCLWNIAQQYMGDGAKYPALYEANRETIDAGNKGTGNPKYTIYPRQVLTIP